MTLFRFNNRKSAHKTGEEYKAKTPIETRVYRKGYWDGWKDATAAAEHRYSFDEMIRNANKYIEATVDRQKYEILLKDQEEERKREVELYVRDKRGTAKHKIQTV